MPISPYEPFGEKMVDTAYAWVLAPGSMSAALDLLGKVRGSFAPLCASEGNELAGDKVAGVGGDDIEETGFAFGVAEGLNGSDVLFCDLQASGSPQSAPAAPARGEGVAFSW